MTKSQFIEMIAREQKPLRRFLRGLCGGDGFRADDIAQEALLKAYLSFERFEGRARFSTWLFRIAYNCFYDNERKASKNDSVPLEGCGESVDKTEVHVSSVTDEGAEADRRFEHQRLYMAIGSLSCQEQAVILLFYMEEKSIKEIEAITGMPSGTIRSYLSRGRLHLKSFLENGNI